MCKNVALEAGPLAGLQKLVINDKAVYWKHREKIITLLQPDLIIKLACVNDVHGIRWADFETCN